MNDLSLVVEPVDPVEVCSDFSCLSNEKIEAILAMGKNLSGAKGSFLVGPGGFWEDGSCTSFQLKEKLRGYFRSVLKNGSPEPLVLSGEAQQFSRFPADDSDLYGLFFWHGPESELYRSIDPNLVGLLGQAIKGELTLLDPHSGFQVPIHLLPTPSALLATDGTILQVNEAFSELLGYQAPMPVGANVFDFTPAGRKLTYEVRQATDLENALRNGTGSIIGVGGREIPVMRQITGNVLGNDHNRYTILQVLDLTEIRQDVKKKDKTISEQRSIISDTDHRLQNNLQLVCSLLDYEARSIDTPSIRNVLQKSRTRITAITLLNDFISQTSHHIRVHIDGYLKALAYQVASAKGAYQSGVDLIVEKGNLQLLPQRAQLCGLIVHELIANAYEHAFPQNIGGRIVVRSYADKSDGTCSIVVQDSGIGLPEGSFPADFHSTGFKLIQILLRQLNAEISYKYEDGSHFSITFRHLKKESK